MLDHVLPRFDCRCMVNVGHETPSLGTTPTHDNHATHNSILHESKQHVPKLPAELYDLHGAVQTSSQTAAIQEGQVAVEFAHDTNKDLFVSPTNKDLFVSPTNNDFNQDAETSASKDLHVQERSTPSRWIDHRSIVVPGAFESVPSDDCNVKRWPFTPSSI
ncbi:hypothetical protein AC1031_017549 [Aphanomyces cochlioides]|nr:hypothetical protein AC1031_017549 [Aphanomyces cochlioides]